MLAAVGRRAARQGHLSRVALAAVVLTGLAAFEATGPLQRGRPAAGGGPGQRAAHLRGDRPARPGDRAGGSAARADRSGAPAGDRRADALLARTARSRWTGSAWTCRPARHVASAGPLGCRQEHARHGPHAHARPRQRRHHAERHLRLAIRQRRRAPRHRRLPGRPATCSTPRSARTSGWPGRMRPRRSSTTSPNASGCSDWIHVASARMGHAGRDPRISVSGGQRQRLALARALLADPAVLILDEPTAHLDQATGDALMADIRSATRGRTLLLITHDRATRPGSTRSSCWPPAGASARAYR